MTPEQRAQFIANVPDAEARPAAEKLYLASENAWTALQESCRAAGIEVDDDIIESHGDAEIIALNEAYDAAFDAWNNCEEYGDVETDVLDHPVRCSLTGFLIYDEDIVLVHRSTGEHVLKTALGLPLDAITGEFIVVSDRYEVADGTGAEAAA